MSLLKKKRIEAGKTQEEVGSLVGINLAMYQRIENSPENANPKILLSLCQLLNIDMASIFSNDHEEDPVRIFAGEPYKKIFRQVGILKPYLQSTYENMDKESINIAHNAAISWLWWQKNLIWELWEDLMLVKATLLIPF